MLQLLRPESARAGVPAWAARLPWPRVRGGRGDAVSTLMLGPTCRGVRVQMGPGLPTLVEAVESPPSELRRWKSWLRGSRVVLVLDTEQRSVQLRDRPAVPDAELAQALRWPIAEAMAMDAEQLLVAAMPLPPLNEAARAQALGVAARLDLVRPMLLQLRRAGLDVRHIDIVDTAMRGMVLLRRAAMRSVVTVCLVGDAACIGLIRDGRIAGLRGVPLPARAGGSDLELAEQLALNARRTFDYYERQAGLLARDGESLALASVDSLSPAGCEIFASALPQQPERFRVDDALAGPAAVLRRCQGHDQLTALACVAVARLHDHGALQVPSGELAA